MPDVIKKIPLNVFLLALLWTAVTSCAPVGVLIWDWITNWSDPLDWTMIWHQAVVCGGLGAWGFWRKHKALLQLPPALEAAKELASEKTAGE